MRAKIKELDLGLASFLWYNLFMEKLLIDSRMREIEKEKLQELNYELISLESQERVYEEISSHVDVFFCKIKDKLVAEKEIFSLYQEKIPNLIQGETILEKEYPKDIAYNVCQIGDYVFHPFSYTDPVIQMLIKKYSLKKINIKQGYSKCSIAVLDKNCAITTDKKIADQLIKCHIDTIYMLPSSNIKLLKKDGRYSSMQGFIGGAISRIDQYVIVTGDLNKIDQEGMIRKKIEEKKLILIDFPGLDVIDYGGMIKI